MDKLSEELSLEQRNMLACRLHKIKALGYGEVIIKVEKGRVKYFIEKTSYEVDISTSVDIAK